MAAPTAGPDPPGPRDRSRVFGVLFLVVIALLVVTLATQVWLVEVELPQQIRNSQPVVIDQAGLLDDGPYLGCFDFLSSAGGVFVQGQSFALSWDVACPANVSAATIQSIDGIHAPVQVIGSNLPVTIQPGQSAGVIVTFAGIGEPYWGGITLSVVVVTP